MTLEFSLNQQAAQLIESDCIIVGIFADHSLTASGQALDEASNGRIGELAKHGDIDSKCGKTSILLDLPNVKSRRVLVVGLGEKKVLNAANFIKAVGSAIKAVAARPAQSAHLSLSECAIDNRDAAWVLRQCVAAANHASYAYTQTKSKKKDDTRASLTKISIAGEPSMQAELIRGTSIAAGVDCARHLGNLPPNICNPDFLAEHARQIAKEHDGVSVEILDENDMDALGMGSLLAVGRGSANRPKLVILKWNGDGDAKPHVLVGKGITFDTGGINLKTQGGIEEMKFDMCGAASVFGTFVAVAKMRLKLNLVMVVPAVENMCDGDSYRPSDVLTSMSGKTIEVGNTDAEGRLILCDALTYAKRFEPKALVDVATLTGACVIALGKHASGLMSHHDDLANELLSAGESVFDRAWRLPIWEEYQPMLDSTFADVYNIGGKAAGAITAACFLSRFTEGERWAHLDIAGSAWGEGRKGMATGRPVGLLTQWLIDQAK